ncbi:MAG: helix-turn-helix transcriptional regulator [Candidatus Sericytochromatia bacterium]|nr:helix-turn-helix transcriptional regulator [Candidatus Tanganyikabacteria bacterium]
MPRRNLPDRERKPPPGHSRVAPAIGAYIRLQRRKNRLRQDELAALAGVGVRFVGEVEAGKATARLNSLEALLAVFGKTLAIVDAREEVTDDA